MAVQPLAKERIKIRDRRPRWRAASRADRRGASGARRASGLFYGLDELLGFAELLSR
jgi:hypothetical protein